MQKCFCIYFKYEKIKLFKSKIRKNIVIIFERVRNPNFVLKKLCFILFIFYSRKIIIICTKMLKIKICEKIIFYVYNIIK